MKYYLIAGEASGDLHGSNLIKELKKLDTGADMRCWGGDLMQQAGAVLVKHYKDHAFMGLSFVKKIFNNFNPTCWY
jgi:lipid-A-disaccharide synthase